MPLLTARECRQRVRVAAWTGADAYGEAAWGNDVEYAARVVARNRLVRDRRGEQVASTHTVYFLKTAVALDVHDRVTLSTADAHSTEDAARRPALLSVGRYPDDRGREWVVAYLA